MENTIVPEFPFQEEPQKSANVELHLPIEEQSSLLKYSTLKEFQNNKKTMIDTINDESNQLSNVLVGGTTEAKQQNIRSVIRTLNENNRNVYIMWANESMFCNSVHPVSNTIKLVYFRKKQNGEIVIEKENADAITSAKTMYKEYKAIKSANKSKLPIENVEESANIDININDDIKISNSLKSTFKLISDVASSLPLPPPSKSKQSINTALPIPPNPSKDPMFIYDIMEELFSRIFTNEFKRKFEARYRSQVTDNSIIVKSFIPSDKSFESKSPKFVDFPGKKLEYLSSIVYTHTAKSNSYSFSDFKRIMMNASSAVNSSSQVPVLTMDHYNAIATLFNSSVQPYNNVIGEYSHEYYKTALYESQTPEFKFACVQFLQQNNISSTSNPYYKSSLSNDLIKILYNENLTKDSYQSILKQFPRAMDYIYELSNTGPENNPFVVKPNEISPNPSTNVKNVMEFLVDGVLSLFMPHTNNAGIVLPPPNALLGNALNSLNRKNENTRVGFQVGGGAGSIFFSVAMQLGIKIPDDIIIKKTDFDARVYYIASQHSEIVKDIKSEYTKIINYLRENAYFDKEVEFELNSLFKPIPEKNYVIKITNSDIKWRHHTTESNFPAELLSIDILYNVQIGYKNISGGFIELGNYIHTAAIFDIVVKPLGNASESQGEVTEIMEEKRNSMYSPDKLCPIATPITFIKTIIETLSGYASTYNRIKTGKISKDYDRIKILIQLLETYKMNQLKEGVQSDSDDIVNLINDLVAICKEESKKGLDLLPQLLEAEINSKPSNFVKANNQLVELLLEYLRDYNKDYDKQLCEQIDENKLQIADPYLESASLKADEKVKIKKGVTIVSFKTNNNITQKKKAEEKIKKEIAKILLQKEKEEKKKREQETLKREIIRLHNKETQKRKRDDKMVLSQKTKKQRSESMISSSQKKRKTQKIQKTSSSGGKRKNKTRKNQYK
jgi:hypothetical protein